MFVFLTASSPSRQDFALQACAKAWPEIFDAEFFDACDVIARSDEALREVLPSVFQFQISMIDSEAGERMAGRYLARSPAQAAEARERAAIDAMIADSVARAISQPYVAVNQLGSPYVEEYAGNAHLWSRMSLEEYAATRRIDDGVDVLKPAPASAPQNQLPAHVSGGDCDW